MRLITWNCNGAFRRKFEPIDALDADVLVIQECEDPSQSTPDYRSWAGDHAWIGYGKNKGIGIFPRKGQSIEHLAWPSSSWELFLPVRIDDSFNILGVWTQHAAPSRFGYIGQFWHYFGLHDHALGEDTVICGDFNSNAIWDKPGRAWNHSECVDALAAHGFRSLYHHTTGEQHGEEILPTFFLYRKQERPYHLDYVFAHEMRFHGRPMSAQVLVTVGASSRQSPSDPTRSAKWRLWT